MFILGLTVLTLGFVPDLGNRYCGQCIDRRNAAGLLMLAIGLPIAFVLLVIVFG